MESSRTHFEVFGLGLEALSPRKLPCPRLEDSNIFEPLKFCWKTPETSRKICKYLFCFSQLEHRRSQAGLPTLLKFHQWQKCDKKAYCVFSFNFFLAFFAYTSSEQQYRKPGALGVGTPESQFLPANLNVNLEEMDSFRPKSCYLRITSSLFMNVIH